MEEREKLIWFLKDRYAYQMGRKRGEASSIRLMIPHKTLPRVEILLKIYHSMTKEF